MSKPATDILADPRTPAEAKRHWMIDRLWIMAIGSFVLVLSITGILWLGAWPDALAGQRLMWLGWVAIGSLLLLGFIAGSFALGGPVGRWRARWGNKSFGADDDATAARQAYDGGGA